jgi:hypothetical protein
MHATTSPKAIDLKPAALALVAAALFGGGILLGSAMDIRIASASRRTPATTPSRAFGLSPVSPSTRRPP